MEIKWDILYTHTLRKRERETRFANEEHFGAVIKHDECCELLDS